MFRGNVLVFIRFNILHKLPVWKMVILRRFLMCFLFGDFCCERDVYVLHIDGDLYGGVV